MPKIDRQQVCSWIFNILSLNIFGEFRKKNDIIKNLLKIKFRYTKTKQTHCNKIRSQNLCNLLKIFNDKLI